VRNVEHEFNPVITGSADFRISTLAVHRQGNNSLVA